MPAPESIAVVDISRIGLHVADPSMDSFRNIGEQLDAVFSQLGFVFLTGHGVDTDGVIERAMEISRDFFELPEEKKEELSRKDAHSFSGWVAEGKEIFDQADDSDEVMHEIRESFDMDTLEESTKYPDSSLPTFRTIFSELGNKEIQLADRLLTCLSLALQQSPDYLSRKHARILGRENVSAIRSLYYPAIQGELPRGYLRCGEHTDYGTFTLLCQDHLPGLQVRAASGQWLPANRVPGSILLNIGDLLEMWTGGRYPATMHRVMVPDDESVRSLSRQSIAFFIHPDDEVTIQPLQGSHTRFPPITSREHTEKRFRETYKY